MKSTDKNPLIAAVDAVNKDADNEVAKQIAELIKKLKEMKTARIKVKGRIRELCEENDIPYDEKLIASF